MILRETDQGLAIQPRPRRLPLIWVVIGGFWTVFGFLYANQMYVVARGNPCGIAVSWWKLIV